MPPKADPEFRQCLVIDPDMATWVSLACEYLSLEQKPQKKILLFGALRSFLISLIIGQEQPRDPSDFLSLSYNAPPLNCALGEGNANFRRQKQNKIYDFLAWILETKFSQELPNGNRIVLEGYRIPYSHSIRKNDDNFLWLTALDPKLETWRRYAANYFALEMRSKVGTRAVLNQFFTGHIVVHVSRASPTEFFDSTINPPPLENIFSAISEHSRNWYAFAVGDFLDWVLDQERVLNGRGPECQWRNPYPPPRKHGERKVRQDGRGIDREFRWILRIDPKMELWRLLAAEYTLQNLRKKSRSWSTFREFIGHFLERYIAELNQPRDPLSFLNVDYTPPPVEDAHFRTGSNPLPVLYDFIKWVLGPGVIHLQAAGKTVVRGELRNPFAEGTRIGNKTTDRTFSWLPGIHPLLDEWRGLGEGFIRTVRVGIASAMVSLNVLFSQIIVPNRRYWNPAIFLSRQTLSESANWLAESGCNWRGKVMRTGRDFADWILVNHFSVEDDHGRKVVPYEFHNPFNDQIVALTAATYSDTKKIPLPHRYIDECRRILNEGPHFKDWLFAQGAFTGTSGGDWFEVPYESIDPTDPDCVWQERVVNVYRLNDPYANRVATRTAYFLWCPARAVGLYIKLLLPLRTYQVRVLDSGESDTFRFSLKVENNWALNTSPLSRGSKKKPHERGVFRRFSTPDGEEMTGFYINTNKTADVGKDGASRGYFIPWQYDEALRWLAKLRDWQEKYNAITTPTSWASLDNRHSALKSETELAALGETCFLFRDAAAHGEDRAKPLRRSSLETLWARLCLALEDRIYKQGTRLPNGEQIRFARFTEGTNRKNYLSLFPLHSLRVSLLTLFAVEGGVPLVYLSKLLAGHSRLLMTIYYIKPGIVEMTETMADALNHINSNQLESEVRWLAEAAERDLEMRTAHNDHAALDAILGGRPGAGWIWDSKGVCPVGRVRCNDGGPIYEGKHQKVYSAHAPVPGGPGNCVRCRFFITGPAFLPGLVSHQNLLSYRFGELGRRYQETDERISHLKDKRDSVIANDTSFRDEERRELSRLEVELERIQGQIDQVGGDVIATHKLIQRSLSILNRSAQVDPDSAEDDSTIALVSAGCMEDVGVSLEEVTELHQLSVLCENAVLYPESEDDSAIYRRSQLIDAALETHRLKPLLCRLSKEEQLRVGNHLMRFLSAHAGSLREAVGILESTKRLTDIGLLTEAVRVVNDPSEAAKPVSLVTLSGRAALNQAQPRQTLSAASGTINGGL